jgi:MFS family permease
MVLAPVVGLLLDKVGACSMMTAGILVTSTGILLAAFSYGSTSMLVAFTLAGVGFGASFLLPSALVVAEWMPQRRSWGMGVVMGAMSFGAAALSPLIGWCAENYGWRLSLDGVAAIISVLVFPVRLTLRATPPEAFAKRHAVRNKVDRRAAIRDISSPIYLVTALGCMFAFVGLGCVQFHVISILLKAGYTSNSAALAFGGTWLLCALGAYALGIVGDRFGAVKSLSVALGAGALGTLSLLYVADSRVGVAFVAIFVMLWGASSNCVSQLTPVILLERFGSEHLGTLVGIEFGVSGLVGAAAPLATGVLYDKFGDYRLAIYLSATATAIASILIWLIDLRQFGSRNDLPRNGVAAA